jgi:plastocyanin
MTRIRSALAAATLVVALGAAAPATSATSNKLVATVGPGFTISLTKGGQRVRTLKPGIYTITVRDRAPDHNFHIRGPRVNKDSGIARVGTSTWRVTLRAGRYTYVCDPHATSMRGTFSVR